MKSRTRCRDAFTLVELMVSAAIIVLLAAMFCGDC
jgi:prepilin-type N-terminal cleavage/methylation domain-containing protein